MGRLLSIDYGTVRTGIAWTDPLRIIATGIGSFPTTEIISKLKVWCKDGPVDEMILGFPLRLNNEDSHSTQAVREFTELLKNEFPGIPIHLWDERFTTVIAKRVILESGIKKEKRKEKGLADSISATLILQNYISALK